MDNITEGFDGGSNAEFARFFSYAQRSCTEVMSQLYSVLDRNYLDQPEFEALYKQAKGPHAKIGGFIKYLRSTKSTGS